MQSMKVLVIGSGGREHALVKALIGSPSVAEVFVAPGSDATGMIAKNVSLSLNFGMNFGLNFSSQDFSEILNFIKSNAITLVVIGPEQPLVDGLADALRAKGVLVFGPGKAGAQLEGSKIFFKEFIEAAGAPTARSFVVRSVLETVNAAKNFRSPWVLKADGLAAGKGVTIHKDIEELEDRARELFDEGVLGEAGRRALLEEFSPGWELSYLILTNGTNYVPLPLAQDHKRLGDGDLGPNTGGMGVVAPLLIESRLEKQIQELVLEPVMKELQRRAYDYRGVLYVGLMITDRGPSVLEFNVRFGDPEAQVILPLLDGDWGRVLASVAKGELPTLKWKKAFAACVVMAAPGYPDTPEKDVPFEGDPMSEGESRWFLHAGTKKSSSGWATNGGRVLNAVGIGATLKLALEQAYQQASTVRWRGLQMRKDIGGKVTGTLT